MFAIIAWVGLRPHDPPMTNKPGVTLSEISRTLITHVFTNLTLWLLGLSYFFVSLIRTAVVNWAGALLRERLVSHGSTPRHVVVGVLRRRAGLRLNNSGLDLPVFVCLLSFSLPCVSISLWLLFVCGSQMCRFAEQAISTAAVALVLVVCKCCRVQAGADPTSDPLLVQYLFCFEAAGIVGGIVAGN